MLAQVHLTVERLLAALGQQKTNGGLELLWKRVLAHHRAIGRVIWVTDDEIVHQLRVLLRGRLENGDKVDLREELIAVNTKVDPAHFETTGLSVGHETVFAPSVIGVNRVVDNAQTLQKNEGPHDAGHFNRSVVALSDALPVITRTVVLRPAKGEHQLSANHSPIGVCVWQRNKRVSIVAMEIVRASG